MSTVQRGARRQSGSGNGKGDPNRAEFARYKQDVKERGKPFFPFAMFHDTVMSMVVVSVIAGLACIWYFTSGEEPGDAGLLGPRYTEEANPATISFVPRPDWYFYFLFYLLRIFKWPESVILGTVGIPTICLILLFAVPFIDKRRERRLSHRPGRGNRRDPRHRLDGRPHLEGGDCQGVRGERGGGPRRRLDPARRARPERHDGRGRRPRQCAGAAGGRRREQTCSRSPVA